MTRKNSRILESILALAVALVVCAIAVANSPAMPYREPNRAHGEQTVAAPAPTGTHHGFPRGGLRPGHHSSPATQPAAVNAAVALRPRLEPQPGADGEITLASASSGGFDWGDAGIGAGGMFGLVIIVLGASLVVSSRREHATARAVR